MFFLEGVAVPLGMVDVVVAGMLIPQGIRPEVVYVSSCVTTYITQRKMVCFCSYFGGCSNINFHAARGQTRRVEISVEAVEQRRIA